MRRITRAAVCAALPTALLCAPMACQVQGDDAEPTDRTAMIEHEATEGLRVEFALDPDAASHEQIEDVARYVESLGDVSAAKVKALQEKDDALTIAVELYGANFPSEDEIKAKLRAEFPFLKDAIIRTEAFDPADAADAPSASSLEAAASDEDPEAVKQRVIEELRAQGVEGDVHVDVEDDGEGRREVKVRVEKRDEGSK